MAQDSDGKEQHVHGAQDISTFDVEGVIEIDPPESGLDAHRGPPLWTWLLLVAAVRDHDHFTPLPHPLAPSEVTFQLSCLQLMQPCSLWIVQVLAVSSAGVVFALMPDVPFLTLAGWRLQSSSVIMGVLAVYQFWRMPVEARQETLRQVSAVLPRLALCSGSHAPACSPCKCAARLLPLPCSYNSPYSGCRPPCICLPKPCMHALSAYLRLSHQLPHCVQGLLLGVSGSCLAGHFGSWVYSVQHTSLSHSLLFVSATPLILAGGAWLLRKPISRGALAWLRTSLACKELLLQL